MVIAALVAALVGGSAAWVGWAKESPTKESVEALIDAQLNEHTLGDPYTTDAKVLEYRLAENTRKLGEVEESMGELKRDVGEIMGVLKALSSQLDHVSDQLARYP